MTPNTNSVADSSAADSRAAVPNQNMIDLTHNVWRETHDPIADSSDNGSKNAGISSQSKLPQLVIDNADTQKQGGFIHGLARSFAHSAIQTPLEATFQLIDNTVGKPFDSHLYASVKDALISAPAPAAFGSAEWHGQAIGGALGVLPWFAASGKGLSMVGAIARDAGESTFIAKVVDGGITGAAYSAAFKPVEQADDSTFNAANYWSAKADDVSKSFFSFATLTASSIFVGGKLSAAVAPIAEVSPRLAPVVGAAARALTGALSGVPAAAVDIAADAAVSGQMPTFQSFAQNAYSYGVVGGALGLHGGKSKSAAEKANGPALEELQKALENSKGLMPGVNVDVEFPNYYVDFPGVHPDISHAGSPFVSLGGHPDLSHAVSPFVSLGGHYDPGLESYKNKDHAPAANLPFHTVEQIKPLLNQEQASLDDIQLKMLASLWYALPASDWVTLSAKDTEAQLSAMNWTEDTVNNAGIIFKNLELRNLLNSGADLPEVKRIVENWESFTPRVKALDTDVLNTVARYWTFLSPEQWAQVADENLENVARASKIAWRYEGTDKLVANPDFADWHAQNHEKYDFYHTNWFLALKHWEEVKDDIHTKPVVEILEKAGDLATRKALKEIFGEDSPVLSYISELPAFSNKVRPSTTTLSAITEAFHSGGEKRRAAMLATIKQLVDEKAGTEHFARPALDNRLDVDTIYADNAFMRKQLPTLFDTPDSLKSAVRFAQGDGGAYKDNLTIALSHGYIPANTAEWQGLTDASRLASRLDKSDAGFLNILERQKTGLNCAQLDKVLTHNPQYFNIVKDMLAEGQSNSAFTPRNLLERDSLRMLNDFTPEQTARLKVLQGQGLSVMRLVQHLIDAPQDKQHIKSLVDAGKGRETIDNFLRLAVYPADVNLQLVEASEAGKIATADVVAKTRDLASGSNFRDLLTAQVRAGKMISREMLEDLSRQAQAMPKPIQSDFAPPQLSEAGQSVSTMANTFRDALDGIQKTIPADQPIVLLGRDAWPLVPILRRAGRDAHYFMWSRLQNEDQPTKNQWLKEVPPNAAVIDTGYSGSIIRRIQSIDPSASGYLLSCNTGDFPTLLSSPNHAQKVSSMESMPKLIYRSQSHTARGGAISRPNIKAADQDAVESIHEASRWTVERSSRQLLRQSGLPDWDVWRYSTFVGLTPKERLGVSTSAEVENYYDTVAALRSN